MSTENKAIVADLPVILSQSIPTALVKYQREDFAADYAIGNTPWLSGASDKDKISRVTTTYQKERIDQGSSAGENSLSNWWLRSATSWHNGAGERYYDADSSDLYRFNESNNIDVWNTGEFKLLPATTNLSTSAASNPVTVSGGAFFIEGTTLKYYNATSNTSTSISLGAGVVPYKLTTDGIYAIVGASDGIYDVTTAGAVRKLWNLPNYAGPTSICQAIAYVKERIIIAFTEDSAEVGIYEASRVYTTPTPRLDASHERWDTPVTSTVVNSITELNGAIAVAYTQGVISRVLSFAIDTASPLAAILDPIVIAEFPRGETINQIRSYLSEYVVIATTKGIRVGSQDSNGTGFSYGALIIEDNIVDIAFSESYIYATRALNISGTNGLWRIDLGTPLGQIASAYGSVLNTSYAYAADLVTDAGSLTGVAFISTTGRKFITSSTGVWLEHATDLATNGYLKSGWIRWGTAEKKQPISVAIKSSGTGVVGFLVEDQLGNNTDIGSIPIEMDSEVQLSGSLSPADHFEITINLTRNSSDATDGPIIEEWQIRALPAPLRSRTITLPLVCFEEESDSNGVTRVSNPWERIFYLERLEQAGGAVLLQDFSSGEERVCQVRAIQFEQASPPTFANGFGGLVTVQLQTIDTEQAIT